MTKSEKAARLRQQGFNCSQSVLSSFAPGLGISEDDSLKIATPFGGGMGRQQMTCGAVTGALMVLGLRFGMGKEDPSANKSLSYAKTVEFFNEFVKINGSLNCRELLNGLDMNDPSEYQKIVEQDMFTKRCNKYVGDAVAILEKITNG